MTIGNIFELIPDTIENELFDVLLQNDNVKVERIVSKGHSSPKSAWYDQDQNEWVIILEGEAIITLFPDEQITLKVGDHLNITAHVKHKVSWTAPDSETIWLAVHY